MKNGDFHCYVSSPEGIYIAHLQSNQQSQNLLVDPQQLSLLRVIKEIITLATKVTYHFNGVLCQL